MDRLGGMTRVLHFLGIGRLPKRPMDDATGGTERVALEIARVQARRGVKVTVACMAPEAWTGTWEGVQLRHLKPYPWAKVRYRGSLKDFRVHLPLIRCARLGRFDIVHLHEYRFTRFLGRPSVVHFHNNPLDGLPDTGFGAAAGYFWMDLGKAQAQIAVSSFVGRRLQLSHEQAGPTALPANIVVNQSGVDANVLSYAQQQEARTRIRRELGLKDSDVLFIFVGAVRSGKGVIQLAQAFTKLAAEHGNVHLAVAGSTKLWLDSQGPKDTGEQQARAILAEALAQRRVSLLGLVAPAALPPYYAAADVLVMPSIFQEGFGLVILEAFAAGIPVIGARSGAVSELVEEERTGLLVDPGDADSLHHAMHRLLLDHDLRQRLGAAGRQTALNMPWEKTVDRLEKIYRGAMASRSEASRCDGFEEKYL